MIRKAGFLLVVAAAALSLSGCGGNGDDSTPAANASTPAKVAVEDLPSGSYVVSVGDVDAPTVGKYYAGPDGSRLLVLADGSDKASQLYRRAPAGEWVAVPASMGDVSVKLLRSNAAPARTPAVSALAGRYVVLVEKGMPATFDIGAAGDITAGASACKLSGKFAQNASTGTLKVDLVAVGCGSLPAASTGIATTDDDYAPSRFRLVTDSGAQLVDLWAFAE